MIIIVCSCFSMFYFERFFSSNFKVILTGGEIRLMTANEFIEYSENVNQ